MLINWPWQLIPLGVLISIGFVGMMALFYSRASTRHSTHVGGDPFHPRAPLEADERVELRYRAAFVGGLTESNVGDLILTSRRAIFLPARFPWEHREPISIDLRAITGIHRDRLPAAGLGVLGRLVRGLQIRTADTTYWLGKPNVDKIEYALRTRTGL